MSAATTYEVIAYVFLHITVFVSIAAGVTYQVAIAPNYFSGLSLPCFVQAFNESDNQCADNRP